MPAPVAVTGGTGFIGSVILSALLGRGWSVNALTRVPRHPNPGIRWIHGHLADSGSLSELTGDCDTIIHCAGLVRGASAAQFNATNLGGTANLLAAIRRRRTPVRLLVAREPHLSWYADSKYRAEQLLSAHAGAIQATVFRPTAVYGPGDREIRPLLDCMRRGFLPLPRRPHQRFSLLHVHDLAAAVLCWLAASRPGPGPYELDDGMPGGYDGKTITAVAQASLGRRMRVISLPIPLLYCAAGLNLLYGRVTGRLPMLTPGKVRELTHANWVCDNGPVRTALDWSPRIRLADALRDSAQLLDG
ncbi:MAG: NAD-dependent epimerase/dehydratase family protein [Gammaproteobacteria bacterium]|nr:NAD-dependent epimerase/dehydratase family protein [Gammaproteobacteria bacterium]